MSTPHPVFSVHLYYHFSQIKQEWEKKNLNKKTDSVWCEHLVQSGVSLQFLMVRVLDENRSVSDLRVEIHII